MTLAYYYEKRGETDMIVPSLFKALEFTNDKARNFTNAFYAWSNVSKCGIGCFLPMSTIKSPDR